MMWSRRAYIMGVINNGFDEQPVGLGLEKMNEILEKTKNCKNFNNSPSG